MVHKWWFISSSPASWHICLDLSDFGVSMLANICAYPLVSWIYFLVYLVIMGYLMNILTVISIKEICDLLLFSDTTQCFVFGFRVPGFTIFGFRVYTCHLILQKICIQTWWNPKRSLYTLWVGLRKPWWRTCRFCLTKTKCFLTSRASFACKYIPYLWTHRGISGSCSGCGSLHRFCSHPARLPNQLRCPPALFFMVGHDSYPNIKARSCTSNKAHPDKEHWLTYDQG